MYDSNENGSLRTSIVKTISNCTAAIPIIIFFILAPLFVLIVEEVTKKIKKLFGND